MRCGAAVRAGAHVSFHNDGRLSPPFPLLNIQTTITRTMGSDQVHGTNQIISLEDALKAETTGATYMVHRENEIVSLAVGLYADLVELSMGPYMAEPTTLATQVIVQGTWLSGKRVDLDSYMTQIQEVEAAATHPVDHQTVMSSHNC